MNGILLFGFLVNIITLLIGFNLSKNKKDQLNKSYQKYKLLLLALLNLIFLLNLVVIYLSITYLSFMKVFFVALILFILYFNFYSFFRSRCWKQHRIILFNMVSLPLFYFNTLVLGELNLNYLLYFLLGIYNILEFRFAMFDFHQLKIWN